jgi:transcriptional regulator with XRE-family HTH domain
MTCNATTQLHPAYGSVLLAVAIEPEEIGKRIKAARSKLHWTQFEFARHASVSLSTIARWEAGKLPAVRELIRIADILEIPAEQLVEPDPEEASIVLELQELRERQERLEEMVAEIHTAVVEPPDTPARLRRAQGGKA